VTDPDLVKHLRQTMFDFTIERLQPRPVASPSSQ
jgi:hypothetical protein